MCVPVHYTVPIFYQGKEFVLEFFADVLSSFSSKSILPPCHQARS